MVAGLNKRAGDFGNLDKLYPRRKYFNILPQFYGFRPVDEVIRRSRTGLARSGNATGFNPWLFNHNWYNNPILFRAKS